MAREIGVGIFGCGQVAREHAKAYLATPNCRIVGLASRTYASAESLKRELKLTCRIHTSFSALISNPRIDAVSICTPNSEHASQAIQAARAGKHICLEKPVAINLKELQELRDTMRTTSVKSIVGYVLHWNPQMENVKKLIESGAIGQIYYAEADYWHGIPATFPSFSWLRQKSMAGGAVIAGGCHAVDMLRWMVDSEIVEVSATSVKPRENGRTVQIEPQSNGARFEYETTITALVRFSNGAIGKIGTCLECRGPYMFNLDLLGTEGTVRDNRIYSRRLMPGQTGFSTIPTIRPDSGAVTHHPFREEIDSFIQAILNNRNAFPDIEDGVKTQEVCLAIESSALLDKPVKLPLLKDSEADRRGNGGSRKKETG